MWYELLPILLLLPIPLAGVALFSGVETALFSLTYHDRLKLRKQHAGAADAVAYLLSRPRGLLVLVLFLNMIAATLYFVLTSIVILRSDNWVLDAALTIINVVLVTLVGEVISKMLAARYRVEASRFIAPPLMRIYKLCAPLISWIENVIVSPLVRVLVSRKSETNLTAEELDALLHLGTKQGAIDIDEQRVLQQVIRLSGLRVRDVMTHRVDMHWIDRSATLDEVRQLVSQTRLTRLVVCETGQSLDEGVVGLLVAKRYLVDAISPGTNPSASKPLNLDSYLEPVTFTPDRASLDKLLERFRASGTKIAVVVDEHGSVVGMVSVSDIVQRLIRELADEDSADDESQIEAVGPGTWIVPGRLSIKQWPQLANMGQHAKFDRRVSTVAGLVFARLGRLPAVGDHVQLGNVSLVVTALDGKMASRVFITVNADASAVPHLGANLNADKPSMPQSLTNAGGAQ